MKRFFLGFLVCCSVLCSAEDIIITQDAKSIKGRITEIGTSEIKYIPSDNPTGPTYSILRSNVVTIVYENGKVEYFQVLHDEEASLQTSAQEEKDTPSNGQPNQEQNAENALILPGQYDPIFWNDEDECFTFRCEVITKEQYLALAKQNCYQAYEIYKQRYVRKYVGASFLGAGVSTLVVSTVVEGACRGESIGGWVLFGLGQTFTAVGIPLLCIGRKPEEHSVEEYNAHRFDQKGITSVDFQCSQDGVGLVLHF